MRSVRCNFDIDTMKLNRVNTCGVELLIEQERNEKRRKNRAQKEKEDDVDGIESERRRFSRKTYSRSLHVKSNLFLFDILHEQF